MAPQNTGFTAAYAKASLAAACAFAALALLAHCFVLFPSGVHAGQPAHAWRAIVRLAMVVGPAGLLACVGLLAAGAVLFVLLVGVFACVGLAAAFGLL